MTTTPGGDPYPLGPGVLHIGKTGALIDISCLINNAVISASKSQDDSVTKLCGTVVPGAVTYDYTLGGNIDLDVGTETGFFALSQEAPGQRVAYTFTPNNDAGATAAGELILDPLDFGGDETTTTMAADFEFALVGQPDYSWATTP